ncbi:MAG: patatin-like phospholipase family protein [Alphaproteobacteria bacterium]|nr:patatin-like phospholipase family protein [Alphaproteobacteria bacterium]MBO6863063.1 patatin-like phospholipase family protein [Alphaproteobacteria bacterium]
MYLEDMRLPGRQEDDTGFHLSLVMAGAVSAGAYTAGVLDFLIEALDALETARAEGDPMLPQDHRITVDAVLGASAGGISGALLASVVRGPVKGVAGARYDPQAEHSVLYRSWVEEVDIAGMLRDDDLTDGKPLVSLLNTLGEHSIDGIRDRAVDIRKTRTDFPAWLRDPLPIYLSTTNLRGVPYNLSFIGEAGTLHAVTAHKDYARFAFGTQDPGWVGHGFLDFNTDGSSPAFRTLADAAMGTAAFPFALRPRRITTDRDLYNQMHWPVPLDKPVDGKCMSSVKIRPDFPGSPAGGDFAYWTVDGGTINNEPIEIGRRLIADESGRNERDPVKSTRKLIMVDPFPNVHEEGEPKDGEPTIGFVLGALMSALKQQARFKPEDLAVLRNGTPSRYVIAPARYELDAAGNERPAKYAVAGGALGAFGGFLDIGFRHHDYILGRINTQRFLASWFTVPVEHRLIAGRWSDEQIDYWKIARDDGSHVVPIIPLVGGMNRRDLFGLDLGLRPFTPPWPSGFADKLPELKGRMKKRIGKVLCRLIDENLDNSLQRVAAKAAVGLLNGAITGKAIAKIEAELQDADLL